MILRKVRLGSWSFWCLHRLDLVEATCFCSCFWLNRTAEEPPSPPLWTLGAKSLHDATRQLPVFLV